MFKSVDLFYEPRKIILPKIDAPAGEPEMSEFDSAFLCGIIKKFRPNKIVEIGAAGGGHNRYYIGMYGAFELAL